MEADVKQSTDLMLVSSCSQRVIVKGADSKRDARALRTPLGNPPEVPCYLRSGVIVTADGEAEESAKTGLGLDTQGSLNEGHGDFRAQGSVVGQNIYPGMP
jgi:hypothetical protein